MYFHINRQFLLASFFILFLLLGLIVFALVPPPLLLHHQVRGQLPTRQSGALGAAPHPRPVVRVPAAAQRGSGEPGWGRARCRGHQTDPNGTKQLQRVVEVHGLPLAAVHHRPLAIGAGHAFENLAVRAAHGGPVERDAGGARVFGRGNGGRATAGVRHHTRRPSARAPPPCQLYGMRAWHAT